jgi:hypothetical protein
MKIVVPHLFKYKYDSSKGNEMYNDFNWKWSETKYVNDLDIFVVRESQYHDYEKEWIDLKRPVCFRDLAGAQKYVEERIDEVNMKRKFDNKTPVNVEKLASSMTWYYTMKTDVFDPVTRFEIYSTKLLN